MTRSSPHGGVVAWPWLEGSDAALCERSLAALGEVEAIPRRDVGWLSSSLKRAAGALPGRAIPWASWAMRLCERAHLPAAAGDVAVAVAAVSAGDPAAPDDLSRGGLAARVLGLRVDGSRAHEWMLCLADARGASAPENPPVAGACAGLSGRGPPGARELVALWTAPALIAGDELAPFCRFGQAVAEPVWVLDGLVRLWLDPDAPDLPGPALTPLLALWLAEPELAPPLLCACAGERASPARRLEIERLVASRPFRAALASRAGRMLASAREALAEVPPAASGRRGLSAAAGAEFLDLLGERFRFFDGLMSFRGLLRAVPAAGPGAPAAHEPQADRSPTREAHADLRAAIDFLMDTAPWAGSWEVQRFGVLGSSEQPVGQWFVRATILQTLHEAGRDVRAEAAGLLEEIPPGELRYYGPFRGVPPDADDLAIMLQLADLSGAELGRVETWIEVMLANVGDDGLVPTWFYRSPAGPTAAGVAWAGNGCSAVRLNLLSGLLSFDAARFAGLIDANARSVLAAAGDGVIEGAYHYDASTTALAFLRFARQYRGKVVAGPLAREIAEVEVAIRARDAGAQRLDGGWGSPQLTAACLEGAAMAASPDPSLLDRALRYLSDHQLADGSWPAEPLYRNPAKRGRAGHHRGRALTSALCARALAAASACVRSERHEEGWRG